MTGAEARASASAYAGSCFFCHCWVMLSHVFFCRVHRQGLALSAVVPSGVRCRAPCGGVLGLRAPACDDGRAVRGRGLGLQARAEVNLADRAGWTALHNRRSAL